MAALVLAACTGIGHANASVELSVAEGELGRVAAEGRAITFTEAEGEFSIICDLQETIRLNRTIAKSAGAQVGTLTTSIRNCRGGTYRMLVESQPWELTYVSFSGTLPNITSLRLEQRRFSFLAEAFFGIARCLYSGNLQVTTGGASSTITELRIDETRGIALATRLGGAACPTLTVLRGRYTVSPTVRMRLVEERRRAERCATPPVARVDEAFQRQEAANATIDMTIQIECEGSRITSIGTARANESIGIEDRERATERTYRRGDRVKYTLRLTAREGTRVVEEDINIATREEVETERSTTRVRFRDL
ncbi:MAG: hypothetical protein WBC33_08620 [Conexibacter sp.]